LLYPGLGKRELFQLAKNAIEFIFASDGVKQDLRRTFDLASNKMDL
jgi:adenosine deaminase